LTITSAQHINQFPAYRQQSSAKALGKAFTFDLQFRLSTDFRLTDSPLLFVLHCPDPTRTVCSRQIQPRDSHLA
jgi:hypothetical protein